LVLGVRWVIHKLRAILPNMGEIIKTPKSGGLGASRVYRLILDAVGMKLVMVGGKKRRSTTVLVFQLIELYGLVRCLLDGPFLILEVDILCRSRDCRRSNQAHRSLIHLTKLTNQLRHRRFSPGVVHASG
jgi:hypothetical protein